MQALGVELPAGVACIQGSADASIEPGLGDAVTTPFMATSIAVPRLFQKPRQGRGAIEPRFTGGAVTALGCRSSRKLLRAGAGSVGSARIRA